MLYTIDSKAYTDALLWLIIAHQLIAAWVRQLESKLLFKSLILFIRTSIKHMAGHDMSLFGITLNPYDSFIFLCLTLSIMLSLCYNTVYGYRL